jgi:hypothetical protein
MCQAPVLGKNPSEFDELQKQTHQNDPRELKMIRSLPQPTAFESIRKRVTSAPT